MAANDGLPDTDGVEALELFYGQYLQRVAANAPVETSLRLVGKATAVGHTKVECRADTGVGILQQQSTSGWSDGESPDHRRPRELWLTASGVTSCDAASSLAMNTR